MAHRSGRAGPLHCPVHAGGRRRNGLPLRREGSLRDLQGVLYFTDGKGIYPAKRPPFEVAFLFLEDGTPPPDVPPWAMRLVLQPEEFTPDTDPKGR